MKTILLSNCAVISFRMCTCVEVTYKTQSMVIFQYLLKLDTLQSGDEGGMASLPIVKNMGPCDSQTEDFESYVEHTQQKRHYSHILIWC